MSGRESPLVIDGKGRVGREGTFGVLRRAREGRTELSQAAEQRDQPQPGYGAARVWASGDLVQERIGGCQRIPVPEGRPGRDDQHQPRFEKVR